MGTVFVRSGYRVPSLEDSLRAALQVDRVPSGDGTYALERPLTDSSAVGRSWRSDFVFVGPGQAAEEGFVGPHCEFRPWTRLDSVTSGDSFQDASVLLLNPPYDEAEVFDAVAAVFRGLTAVATQRPDALGGTVRSLRLFLESGLKPQVSRDTEVGLLGELLVIACAADPKAMVDCWHRRANATHDFSSPGERLEVKATTGTERSHHFTQGQVAATPGVCTTFASVVMPEIEGGTTVTDLVAEIDTLLEPVQGVDFLGKVMTVTGCPPSAVSAVKIDRNAAAQSIWHLDQSAVPRPTAAPGVSEMRWRSTISEHAAPAGTCQFVTQMNPSV